MKVIFIATSLATVYFIYHKFRATYEAANDTFHLAIAYAPAIVLALIWNYKLEFIEV